MSYGHLLEAEYEDGFILREQPEDINPYGVGNTYTAILNHQPREAGHGQLVRFGIYPEQGGNGLQVDWKGLPDNAEPVYYRQMAALMIEGAGTDIACQQVMFGYRYKDADTGNMVEEISELV